MKNLKDGIGEELLKEIHRRESEIDRRKEELQRLREAYSLITDSEVSVEGGKKSKRGKIGRPGKSKASQAGKGQGSEGGKGTHGTLMFGKFRLSPEAEARRIESIRRHFREKRKAKMERDVHKGMPKRVVTTYGEASPREGIGTDEAHRVSQVTAGSDSPWFVPVGNPRKNRAWTDEEDVYLRKLLNNWGSQRVAEIAKTLRRSVRNVERRVVKLKQDDAYNKIMGSNGKRSEAIRQSWDKGLTKTAKHWSSKECKTLLEMAGNGFTAKQVSKELGRSVAGINSKFMKLTGKAVLSADRKYTTKKGMSAKGKPVGKQIFSGG